jgi:hypothetical protein
MSFLICCNTAKKEAKQYNEKRYQFLIDFMSNTDTLSEYKYDKDIFHFEKLFDDHQNHISKAFIYVLNSECSICIGEFLDFVFHVKEIKDLMQIVVITESGSKETLNYYLEQTGLNNQIELSIYENIENKYIEGSLERQNGNVFYVHKNKIISKFSYESLIGLDENN